MNPIPTIDPIVSSLEPQVITDRRWCHQHPELSSQEYETAAYIAATLRGLGLVPETGICETGVVARIIGAKPGPNILYRADMDALPIKELNAVEYRSQREGVMHACGHDAHVALALGLARLAVAHRDQLRGTITLVFQPREEEEGAARAMINYGVMNKPSIDYVLGLHVDSSLDTGSFGINPGPTYAGCHDFALVLEGAGGHAAHPEETQDLILLAATIISAAQGIISRGTPALEPAILSFGTIHAGTKENIIPNQVKMTGTIRAYEQEVLNYLETRLDALVAGIVMPDNVTYRLDFEQGFPPLVNNPHVTEILRKILLTRVEADRIFRFRTLGADDMAYFLAKAPGCYFQLGVHNPEEETLKLHHSPTFDIDEQALILGLQIVWDMIDALAYDAPPGMR